MPDAKVATCCYCGTKAALVLQGVKQHELACTSCGAPLHNLKKLPTHRTTSHPIDIVQTKKPMKPEQPIWTGLGKKSKSRKKKSKSALRWLLKEAIDVVEDIFD